MRTLTILVLSGALGLIGCSETSNPPTGGTGGATGGTGGMAGMGGDGGMGGMAGMAGGAGMGGQGGMGGGATARAEAFCTDFEATCTYGGDNYADRSDCLTSFDGYEAARKDCVEEHMGFAEMGDPELHCGHASGAPPCGA